MHKVLLEGFYDAKFGKLPFENVAKMIPKVPTNLGEGCGASEFGFEVPKS